MDMRELQTFDPHQPFSIAWRNLPHWTQSGTGCFITWWTADSMPREVVERWILERNELLKRHGINVEKASGFGETRQYWKALLRELMPDVRWRVQCELTDQFDGHLDACHGQCVLREPHLANIVAESLLKFDGERYVLTDFVVMPNHVHALVAFPDEDSLFKQCANWKRYTARQINRERGSTGEFWQEDAFDHLVRSPDHFNYYRRYIADNGPRANLGPAEYRWFSRV